MRLHTKILNVALLSAAVAATGFAQSKNPHVDLKETRLDNGLRVARLSANHISNRQLVAGTNQP